MKTKCLDVLPCITFAHLVHRRRCQYCSCICTCTRQRIVRRLSLDLRTSNLPRLVSSVSVVHLLIVSSRFEVGRPYVRSSARSCHLQTTSSSPLYVLKLLCHDRSFKADIRSVSLFCLDRLGIVSGSRRDKCGGGCQSRC